MSKSDILPYEEIAQELCTELKKIYTGRYRDLVLPVLSSVSDYEEDVRELLEFIRTGEDVNMETVADYGYGIARRRDPTL